LYEAAVTTLSHLFPRLRSSDLGRPRRGAGPPGAASLGGRRELLQGGAAARGRVRLGASRPGRRGAPRGALLRGPGGAESNSTAGDRKSKRLESSHWTISYSRFS